MPFLHRPLEPTGRYIRLLDIQPSKDKSAPISCTLTHASIDSGPVYEALSYTWGWPTPKVTILLDGQDFETLQNLAAALHRLRRYRKARTFWVDALCINQADNKEKSTQLALMNRIYNNATQVVVWLGEPDDDNRSAMVSLATKNFSITNNVRIWRAQRKNGVQRAWRAGTNALLTGEVDRGIGALESEIGQVAQLLDRPWWRRVWIVQEVVLARKVVVMCGSDEVPWENIKARLRADTVFGLNSNSGQSKPLRAHNGTIVDGTFKWPDSEHDILDKMRKAWGRGSWHLSFYDLLFQFRRLQCTKPDDRVYAFLGLVTAEESAGISVDYDLSLSQLYSLTARSLMAAHKHLLVLNCKREAFEDDVPHQRTRVYSTLDQGRFVDPRAAVVENENAKPREGWIRLPEGWERLVDDDGIWFHNHSTGKRQKDSPLRDQKFASETVENYRSLPTGWSKSWDNLGRVKFTYLADKPAQMEILHLPSWAPNWNCHSIRDPEPLPDLTDANSCFWASGKHRAIHFVPNSDPDSSILGLRGTIFDTIATIASPWLREGDLFPISRSGVGTLVEWEKLALTEHSDCPYETRGGRNNAFWRTHLADYAGTNALPEDDKIYFDAWCDRTGWTPKAADVERKTLGSVWDLSNLMDEGRALGEMAGHVQEATMDSEAILAYGNAAQIVYRLTKDVFKDMEYSKKRYKEIRSRINKASINRAMFITAKGYIGLAPWNGQKGDSIVVLLGGCTPFLLRPKGNQYNLVGEAYVYGIMGGELFGDEMGHAQLRDFEIV
ncbi:heterokaryon incompatibility protein-domain-containing protein [Phaeosphaeria sp. MPI-PUGE-AT-0046c]|nr:heterokaryon incompatibility protein-domain-containing protein [Phaeosphaeria sp. MPI-PUGE-AT-0046c]